MGPIKKLLLLLSLSISLFGCSTVNFSANYYTPPDNYKTEVKKIWNESINKFALKHQYILKIVSDGECSIKGIPEISGYTVKMPESFLKYAYQNYYDNRALIIDCVVAHEVSHTEFSLFDQSTPQAHFQVDKKAIELLQDKNICSAQDYYKSLFVLKNYWFARKGLAGHTFNLGWNLVQAASMAYGGPASFRDWFATDLSKRMAYISKQYKIRSGSCFKRCQKPLT